MITRIYVHGGHIKHNNKVTRKKDRKPPLIVRTSKGPRYGDAVWIDGPSHIIYRPDKPHHGAKAWIETDAQVTLLNKGEAV